MFKLISRINILVIFFYFVLISPLKAEIIKEINIEGNQRISPETIKMFTGVSVNDNLSDNDLNQILKKLYDTTFFDLVSIKLVNNKLEIIVKENPIIQNINYEGVKSSKILDELKSETTLKSRSSFNELLLDKDKKKIKNFFDFLGIKYSALKSINKVNTNEERGYSRTEIENKDIIILKSFIKKIPKTYKNLILELEKSVSLNEKIIR